MILGSAGTGKSTLAKQISEITKIEATHLDSLFWNAGWIETPKDEMTKKTLDVVSRETWIIDGNYAGTLNARLEVTDTVIFLDFNRYFCLYRVLKRFFQNIGKTRSDMAPGCNERIDWDFIQWIWNYPKKGKIDTLNKINDYLTINQFTYYHLKTPKQVKLFLEEIRTTYQFSKQH